MTLKGIMDLIVSYFTEFGSFCGQLRQSGWWWTYAVYDEV